MTEADEDLALVQDFLDETREQLEQIEVDLRALAAAPRAGLPLDAALRTFHTLKGTSAMLGLTGSETLAHLAEELLDRLRGGDHRAARALPLLDDTVDTLRAVLASLSATGEEPMEAVAAASDQLRAALLDPAPAGPADEPLPLLGSLLVAAGVVTRADVARAVAGQRAGDARRLGQILVDDGRVTPAQVEQALTRQRQPLSRPALRVDLVTLDEFAGCAARLRQIQLGFDVGGGAATAAYTERLRAEVDRLDNLVQSVRRRPARSLAEHLHRVVQTAGDATGKRVRLELTGGDVEVDRVLLDAIRDPLTHLLRNAVDHGIEPPLRRRDAGKPVDAVVRVAVRADKEAVVVMVSDDGAGIDRVALRARAAAVGLLPGAENAAGDPARDLAFTPGLSTAAAVTRLSGRGVGLDVVRTEVVRRGGTVTVTSQPGRGTTVVLRLPLAPPRDDVALGQGVDQW